MEKMDFIYVYFWETLNSVYVGRTINPRTRHYAHVHRQNERTYLFSVENKVKHPEMIIVESGLSIEEGIEHEKELIEYYVNKTNMFVVNKLKGGGVGNLNGGKWNGNKDLVFEESKKYISKSQFKYNSSGAYYVACVNGWLDKMPWLKKAIWPKHKWTKDAVFEEAKKYSTRKEFKKGCETAYKSALKNDWLNEMEWLKIVGNIKWTKDAVFEESRKYKTRGEFQKNSGAYRAALRNKWIDEMTWLKPDIKWTKDAVFEESRKYTTRGKFKNGNQSAYNVARSNNWLNEMTWLK